MATRPQPRALTPSSIWHGEVTARVSAGDSRKPVQPTDVELVARVRAGDSSALETLFDRYSRLLMGIGLQILRDSGEAEEIVQDIFLHIYQKADLYDPARGPARKWIVQLAYHRALDRREYLQRRMFYVGTDDGSVADTLLEETDLDRVVEAKLSRVQIEKAFMELPERQRQTLELFYFKGFDLKEISTKLNEPLPNVRHHYYRGLEKLRKSALIQEMREM